VRLLKCHEMGKTPSSKLPLLREENRDGDMSSEPSAQPGHISAT
jgi:hypothetical protein